MKTNYRRWVIWGSATLVCGGLLAGALEKALARAESGASQPLPLAVDPAPLVREGEPVVSYAPVVKQVAPAVVNIFTTKTIRTPQGRGANPFFDDPVFRRFFGERFSPPGPSQPRSFTQNSLGSGVIVTPDGYVVTNDHVVEGADEIKVAMEESRKEFTARVVGRDPQTDVAVLKIDATDLPYAVFGDSDLVEVGDVVLAIGNPFRIGQSVSKGIVSALGRGGIGIETYEDFIQTDAAINPGNSGGALVDVRGRVIGINTAILSRTGGNHGIGFAIPSNLVRSVLDQLVQQGRVDRGFLGVSIQDLTPELAEEFGIQAARGALVAEVVENSAAAAAGLKRGDVIVAIDGRPVADSRSLRLQIGQIRPGRDVEVRYVRDGRERTATARLNPAPGDQAMRGGSVEPDDPSDDGALRGVGVSDLTPDLRRQFSVPRQVQGAVITDVDPESASFRAGLRPGDVILEINRRRVTNAAEALDACRASREGRTLVNFWRQGGHRYVVVREELE
jgi:serine protease Do